MLAIVIPAFAEKEKLPLCLASLYQSLNSSSNKDVHTIVVVNQPFDLSKEESENNHETIKFLKTYSDLPNLHVLDRTSGLEYGVGEARRIGMDYAVNHLLKKGNDLLVSLDADTTVSRNYISGLSQKRLRGSGFTIEFDHAKENEGIVLYESYLRYMKLMLEKAGSPFAHHTIGSCLGTSKKFYELSGGMPIKKATEDFHFMNKLRKLGEIEHWAEIVVYPSSRASSRVFLGTGYFLSCFQQDREKALSNLMLPSPHCFETLRNVLRLLNHYFDHTETVLDELKSMDVVHDFFLLYRLYERIEKLKNHSSRQETFQKRLIQIFDGLMTYRLLRQLSDAELKPSSAISASWMAHCAKNRGMIDVTK